jgi:hypothetical protein
MYYELVNLSSGNRIGEFDTESDALEDVRQYCERHGRAALGAIALTQADEDGHAGILAEGDELATRAERGHRAGIA